MRIWSIHPKYLDSVGLVALWRETLLAKNVLSGNTKWYKNHPQLVRFKRLENPLDWINRYLSFVYEEAVSRGYAFDPSKIGSISEKESPILVHNEQIQYETQHLRQKLLQRSPDIAIKWQTETVFDPHPMFRIIPGAIEDWEIMH